jgi:hypothetical protein
MCLFTLLAGILQLIDVVDSIVYLKPRKDSSTQFLQST